MKTAAASCVSTSALCPPILNTSRKTSAFLRKLSLKAEKNWVQNRGAKRRVASRDEDMTISGGSIGRCGPNWLGAHGAPAMTSARLQAQVTTAVSDDSQVVGSRED